MFLTELLQTEDVELYDTTGSLPSIKVTARIKDNGRICLGFDVPHNIRVRKISRIEVKNGNTNSEQIE